MQSGSIRGTTVRGRSIVIYDKIIYFSLHKITESRYSSVGIAVRLCVEQSNSSHIAAQVERFISLPKRPESFRSFQSPYLIGIIVTLRDRK